MSRHGSTSSSAQIQPTFAPGCTTWIEKDRHRVVKRAETSETRLILRRLCSLASSLSVQLDVAIPCLQESPDGLFSYPLLPGNPPNPQKDNSALISYETSLGSLLAKLHNLDPNSLPLPQATDPCTSLASMLETVHAAFTLPGHLANTAHCWKETRGHRTQPSSTATCMKAISWYKTGKSPRSWIGHPAEPEIPGKIFSSISWDMELQA